MSRPKDKDEAIAYEAIMRVINELIPTTDYMRAENRATMCDRRWREKYGDDGEHLSVLRNKRDRMMEEAADLARSVARLKIAVDDGGPSPNGNDLFATLGEIFSVYRNTTEQ